VAHSDSGAGVLSNPHRLRVAFESLECRRLLAHGRASPAVALPEIVNNVLAINGTDAADSVGVTRIVVGNTDEIRVWVGKKRYYFATAEIQQIRVGLGAGDDLLDVNQKQNLLEIPIFAAGGAGNDTLIGTVADDSLDGGEGEDSIMGGYGDDLLVGAAGADRMFGGMGSDSLYGDEHMCKHA